MRRFYSSILLTGLTLLTGNASSVGDECACEQPFCRDVLLKMTMEELGCVFRGLSASELPKGYYEGTVIWPGPKGLRSASAAMTRIVWKGKWICPDSSTMLNNVMGKANVPARIGQEPSWIDGCPVVIFDYSCSSAMFARDARDEVRQISNDLYLGVMFIQKDGKCPKVANYFLLERCNCSPCE